jgi:hypothetical protein
MNISAIDPPFTDFSDKYVSFAAFSPGSPVCRQLAAGTRRMQLHLQATQVHLIHALRRLTKKDDAYRAENLSKTKADRYMVPYLTTAREMLLKRLKRKGKAKKLKTPKEKREQVGANLIQLIHDNAAHYTKVAAFDAGGHYTVVGVCGNVKAILDYNVDTEPEILYTYKCRSNSLAFPIKQREQSMDARKNAGDVTHVVAAEKELAEAARQRK